MSANEVSAAKPFVLPADTNITDGKGEFLAFGATSIVERLANGDVVKTPFNHEGGAECRQDLATEASIYQMLGRHTRLVSIRSWNSTEHTLVMEYMPNGTMEKYMEAHRQSISKKDQLRWALQAAEGVQLLHASNILHCDIGPHNFFLDAALNLKIADFSGSSVDGSQATVCPRIHYRAPDPTWKPGQLPTLKEDLFALGSLLYFIFTGYSPFHDLEEDAVEKNFCDGIFPDLSDVTCADIIERCWRQQLDSSQQVYDALDGSEP